MKLILIMNLTLFICGNNIENVMHEEATKTRCTNATEKLTKQSEEKKNELSMQRFDELLKKQKLN